MSRRVRLLVAYDGRRFHGFAPNHHVRTVHDTLTAAVETVVREPVRLAGAGRTDAGVHAWGQVVSGDLPDGVDLDGLVRRLNKLCAPDIAVRAADWVDDDFHARFSARWRQYRYDVWNATTPNPLMLGRAWWVAHPLDVEAMRAGVAPLLGEHDFSSFCRRVRVTDDQPERTRVRRVIAATWTELEARTVAPGLTEAAADSDRDGGSVGDLYGDGRRLRFEIRANAFCHQMVRSIVGTLVDVGLGRLGAAEVPVILAARSRDAAGRVAPPGGLVLWQVSYQEPTAGHPAS